MTDAEAMLLSAKEAEGLLWGLAQISDYVDEIATDPQDPLFVLRTKGWSNKGIAEACDDLMEMCFFDSLPDRATALQADILRCCVENSSWITAYRTNDPTKNSPPHINEALAALRSLSAKLERMGIEISRIPFN